MDVAYFEQNNIIEWIFEKAFDQLTSKGQALFIMPFDKVEQKTFNSTALCHLISKLTTQPLDLVQKYLTNKLFQEKFLFSKIKKKLYVQIIIGNLDKVKYLIGENYQLDYKSLQLISLNNRSQILSYVLDNCQISLDNELLMYCSEFSYEEMFFFFKGKIFGTKYFHLL